MGRFDNKVVVITGASSGIGAATAVHLGREGALLALVGRNTANLQRTATQCKQVGAMEPLLIVADVCKEEDCCALMRQVLDHFHRLDVLINNAGILEMGTVETTSLEQYDRVMNTNVRAVYHLTMLAAPHLAETRGNIVNVSSVNGIRSFPGVLVYNVSKAAVDQITRCVALELAPKGVRVNSVNPGVVVTEIHKRGGLDDAAYTAFLERAKTTHALGRPGTVEEVAEAIAFLASENATFCTGVSLPVDGGRHAMCPR